MTVDHTQRATRKNSLKLDDHGDILSDVLFLSIGEGAIVVDERGIISRVNKPALEILGYTDTELIGRWYPETIIAQDADGQPIPNMERPIIEVFLTGQPVFRRIYFRRKDGSSVAVALTVAPVMHDDKPLGAIELFRDITDELQLEHAKDEFISIASHQLRTPATVVKQYLGMILEGYVPSEEQRLEMIKIAFDHNDNQLAIINDLLKVAQIESKTLAANYKEVDMVSILEKIILSQKPHYDKRNIQLLLTHDDNPATVEVDPLHVQMVFENLIDNANKYSEPDSTVSIHVSQTPSIVTVHVQDQGVGIDQKDIPRLFNKFSRIKNSKSAAGGTGLGLYWAKKLIELYNGTISVTSELHKGTTFSVSIPREKHS